VRDGISDLPAISITDLGKEHPTISLLESVREGIKSLEHRNFLIRPRHLKKDTLTLPVSFCIVSKA
jgi:hypothetical protein